MKIESFDRSGPSSQQAELIFDLCRYKPSDRISSEMFLIRLVQLFPEKDARRSAQISLQLIFGEIANNDAPVAHKSPETLSRHSKPMIDGKGWLAINLALFPATFSRTLSALFPAW